jgi:hypothetical protein
VATDVFEIAGRAACLLEDMGFVAVARRRDGLTTIELWQVVKGEQRAIRVEIDAPGVPATSAEALAEACAARFRAAMLQHQT